MEQPSELAQNKENEVNSNPSNVFTGSQEISFPISKKGKHLDEIIEKIQTIFTYYSSYGDRMNLSNLKSVKFHKLLQDAGLKYNQQIKKSLDLIFCSKTKNKGYMTFELFLDALTDLSKLFYKDSESDSDALLLLTNNNLVPLYLRIVNDTDMNSKQGKPEEEIKKETIEILSSISETLLQVYNAYFPWEKHTSESYDIILNKSTNITMKFLSEFDICPAILTKANGFSLFSHILTDKNIYTIDCIPKNGFIGTVFTFPKFVDFIYKISSYVCDFSNSANLDQSEKLCFLLERMELSIGFTNLEKKTNRPHNSKTSLIPPTNLLRKLVEQKTLNFTDDKKPEENKQKLAEINLNNNEKKQSPKKEKTEYLQIIDEYRESLITIFEKYSSFGEPLNTTNLKSAKFVKMLRDAGLLLITKKDPNFSETQHPLNFLNINDANIIYSKVTSQKSVDPSDRNSKNIIGRIPFNASNKDYSSSTNRMNFETFINSLFLIAQKTMPLSPYEESIPYIIKLHLYKLLPESVTERNVSNNQLFELMQILKDKTMVQLLGLVHKSLQPYYNYYASQNGLMSTEGFLKFCSDFSIFPDVTSKAKLMRMFEILSNIYICTFESSHKQLKMAESKYNGYINDHLFIEALALCALEIPYNVPEPDNIEKVY